jgi:hypothetical protein
MGQGDRMHIEVGKTMRAPFRRYDAIARPSVAVEPTLGSEFVQKLLGIAPAHT